MNKKRLHGQIPQMVDSALKAAAIVGVAGALLASPAYAAPITSDLTINGSVTFDSANSIAPAGSTSAGELESRVGGVNATSAFSASTGGSLAGNLTETGDGFGFFGDAASTGATGTYNTFIDIALSLANTSATQTYRINFNVDFANAVDSDGQDAYADSEFFVRDPAGGPDLFFTDITSDVLNGDAIAGVLTGTSGDPQSDTGLATFFITLLPGASVSFGPSLNPILWSLAGGSFDANSASSASIDAFLSIASVEDLTQQPPNPAPEPATLALLGVGLAGLGALRRRGSR